MKQIRHGSLEQVNQIGDIAIQTNVHTVCEKVKSSKRSFFIVCSFVFIQDIFGILIWQFMQVSIFGPFVHIPYYGIVHLKS